MAGGPTLKVVDGLLALEFPSGRPESFEAPTQVFELLVAEVNAHRRAIQQARAAAASNGRAVPMLEFAGNPVLSSGTSD